MKAQGFTLVEILIVVVVLGILAAAVLPQFSSASETSRSSAAAVVVKGVQRQLRVRQLETGHYPATVEAHWFEGGVLPGNPFFPDAEIAFEIVNDPALVHPAVKTGCVSGGLWYNRGNGIVRARVPAQVSEAETIALYNRIHGSRISSLGQTD